MSIGKLSRLLLVIVVCLSVSGFQCGFGGSDSGNNKEGRGWRVWIRTEPCPGRFDWLSVSKEQPGGGTTKGLGTFWLYDNYLPRQGCTETEPFGCTFAEATALMEKLRGDKKFLDFCCKDYSVAKNTQTGEMTVVLGKYGNAGFGWETVKGDLCCEEAEALAGKTGACSGSTHIGNENTGNSNCPKEYNVYEETRTGKRFAAKGRFTTSEMRLVKGDLCCKEAEDLAGTPGMCSGKTSGGTTKDGVSGWSEMQEASINQGDGQLLTFYPGTTPEQCRADCDKNPQCVAFTLIKAGAYNAGDPPMCYLVSEAKKLTPSSCCITAVKNGVGNADKR